MSEEVGLTIGGSTFTGWEALTITRALDSVADGFSLSGPFDPSNSVTLSAFKPFSYKPAIVKIDGELVLTGQVESVSPSISASDRAINVQGRSKTGPLVECSIDIGKTQFDGLSLSAIAKQICQPFGITVQAINDTNPIKLARANPGEQAFSFLNKLAKDYSLLLNCDVDGRLLIQLARTGGNPVASLVEGQGLLIGVSAGYNGAQRFSKYKVLQQQDGAANIKGEALDSGVSPYRPMVEAGGESNSSDIKNSANWKRALALASSISIEATVSGWRTPGGALWTPGQLVTLKAPGAFVIKETVLMVAGSTLTLDAGGRVASLRLVLPATYTGEMPGGYPWE